MDTYRIMETKRSKKQIIRNENKCDGRTERKCGRDFLRTYLLSEWPSVLEGFMGSQRVICASMYSPFTFEPFHNENLEISLFLKQCALSYLSSEKLMVLGEQRERNEFLKIWGQLWRGCNVLMIIFGRDREVPGTHVGFWMCEA